jgi:hypothetical protein
MTMVEIVGRTLHEALPRPLELARRELWAELRELRDAPELREVFARAAFAADPILPDVSAIRSRLRRW